MASIAELAKQGINFDGYFGGQPAPQEDSNLVRGFKKAMVQIPETLGGSIALAGDIVGADGMRDYGMQVYQNANAKDQALTRDSDSFTHVLNGTGNMGDFLASGAGYVGGQALTALATGGVGGFIGKQLALRGIKGVAERAIESEMAKQVAAKVAEKGIKAGAGGALFASNLSQEAGSIYPDAVQQAQQDGRTLDGTDKARIVGAALAAAGVETAADALMLGKVAHGGRRLVTDPVTGKLVSESLLSAARREIPIAVAREAGTEGVQTGLERFGAGQDMTTADAIRDYVDSMALGAVGGGLGGAAGAISAQKVPESGPLTRAANAGLDEKILQLTHDPEPLIVFPDGSVGHKADFEAYIGSLPPEKQTEARAKLLNVGDHAPKVAPQPEATSSSPEASAANIKTWSDRHDPVDLDYAQRLIATPGAKGLNLMVVPHASGTGYTVVPSKWLSLEEQAKAMALQKGDAARLPGPDMPAPDGRMIVDSAGDAAPETYGDQAHARAGQKELDAAAAEREILGKSTPKGVPSQVQEQVNDGADGVSNDAGVAGADAALEAGQPGRAEAPMAPAAVAAGADAAGVQGDAAAGAAAPDALILNPKGKPFVTEFSARKKLRELKLGDTHEVAPVDDGFVIRQKPDTSAIDAAAHQAATSPQNDLPEPTQAQKEAGNYRKGHVQMHGLDISIENPAGSTRSGIDRNGNAWENTMQHHYGYIRGTVGADKDHIDAFIGPNPDSTKVFVVDQVHPDTGKFDEHKVVLGADSLDEARQIYASNYAKGWKGGKSVAETNIDDFKQWLKDGDTKRPFGGKESGQPAAENLPAPPEPAPDQGLAGKSANDEENIPENIPAAAAAPAQAETAAPAMSASRPTKPAAENGQEMLFNRKDGRPRVESDDHLVDLYSQIAQHDQAFQLPDSDSKSLKGVLADMAPDATIEDISAHADIGEYSGNEEWRKVHRVSEIRIPGDPHHFAMVFETTDKKVWLDISNWEPGKSGTDVYQAVATYAHNAGLQFVGDPMGLSATAAYRRLEQMISSTLRHGTTGHLAPHPRQIAADKLLGDRIKPLDWRPSDHAHNLREMLAASYYNVEKAIPEIADVRYNFSTGRFEAPADSAARATGGASVRAPDGKAAVPDVRNHAAAGRESSVRSGDRATSDRGAPERGTVPVHGQAPGELGHVDAVPFTDADFKTLADEVRERIRLEQASAGGNPAPTFGVSALKRAVLTASILRSEGSAGGRVLLDRLSAKSLQRLTPQLKKLLYRQDPFTGVGTQADQHLIDQVRAGASTADLLATIAKTSDDPQYRAMAQHFLELGDLPTVELGKLDPKRAELQNRDEAAFAAAYSPKRHAVIFFSGARVERNLIHELAHGATYKAIRKGGLSAIQMRSLYEHVEQSGELDGMYGMENLDEFVAEAFSNPDFQAKLQAMTAMPEGSRFKNAWQKFVAVVRRILGLPARSESALGQALRMGANLMQENRAASSPHAEDRLLGNVAHDVNSLLGKLGVQQDVRERVSDIFQSEKTFNGWWHKTVGTQYHKAQVDKHFKRVYDAVQNYLSTVSSMANDAADLAPKLLPKLEGIADLTKKPAAKADLEAAGRAIFTGTLTDSKVYSDAELRDQFKLTPGQIELYREFRAATDKSLDDLAKTTMIRYAGKVGQELNGQVMDAVDAAAGAEMLAERLAAGGAEPEAATVREMAAKAAQLKREGYAPLMRFGEHTVYVTENGKQLFFGMAETGREAEALARQMRAAYPNATVTKGILSKEGSRLFSGISPDTIELFANVTGMEKDPLFQDYLKLVLNNRSALKRLIHRKGVEGFSQDTTRVLASFLTSNARAASKNLHSGEMVAAANDIPKEKGDVRDEAIKLVDYIQNPIEEAAKVRGLLFTNFIGGSIASAAVNMTQPVMMTLPYLSQFGGAGAATSRLLAAMKTAATTRTDTITDKVLREALKRGESEGVVSPQEIHNLQAEAMRSSRGLSIGGRQILSSMGVRKIALVWGGLFSLAEQFNRRATFIAAFQTAQHLTAAQLEAAGVKDAYEFATKAIAETQGVYNRGNRPDWARGALGATLMTFKQYSIAYLEFLKRLPTKERMLALAILAVAAGANGLPFADDLDDVIDTIGQALGYNTNAKEARAKFLTHALGQGASDFVLHGFSGAGGLPLDVSVRMGMSDLLPATGLLKQSETHKERQYAELLGAAGGFGEKIIDTAGDLLAGDAKGGLQNISPTAINNLMKAADMLQTGAYRDYKGRKVIDTDATDALVKAIGFQPSAVAREQGQQQLARQDIDMANAVKQRISDEWAQGIFEQDPEAPRRAREAINSWNEKNPESRIQINAFDVAKKVREMRMSKQERTVRHAPKAMRTSVRGALE